MSYRLGRQVATGYCRLVSIIILVSVLGRVEQVVRRAWWPRGR